MEFKFKTKFTSLARVGVKKLAGLSKESVASVAIASDDLGKLRSLAAPDDEIKDNQAFLYFVANAAVANLINLNGDGITTESALAMQPYWKYQPVNVEHDRRNVIGCLMNSGFSDFSTNDLIASPSGTDPFNISVSGIIWKVIDDYIAEMVENSSEEGDYMYNMISTSWEVGFNEYVIAKGSKNLSRAEMVTDPEEISKLEPYLICCGGSGFTPDGTEVYRVVSGDCRPIGLALTMNPAAAVKGVKAIEVEDEEDDMEDEEDAKCKDKNMGASKTSVATEGLIDKAQFEQIFSDLFAAKYKELSENKEKNKEKAEKDENISEIFAQTDKNTVINNTTMTKLTYQEALATIQDAAVRAAFDDVVCQANEKFVAEQNARAKAEADLKAASDNVKASSDKLKELEDQITELKNQAAEAARQSAFNDRMSSLAEKYDFDEKVSKVIAKQIRDLDDAAFESWLAEDGEVILAGREKQSPQVEGEKETEALASVPAPKITLPVVSSAKTPEKLNIFE